MITVAQHSYADKQDPVYATESVCANWHVLWTHSNCEAPVYLQLLAKGYDVFFATIEQWSANRHGKHLTRIPMFRSYLFIHHGIGKREYIDICNTKGLVRILGDSWDRLAIVPDKEVSQIKAVCDSELTTNTYPFLTTGDRVRVVRGSLKNTEGILIRNNQSAGLLIVSINLLHRSLAVEINCTDVVPV